MRSFWATLTRFDRSQLAPVMAARNALGVAVCLFAGLILHNPAGGVMAATGALDTAFSDGSDPYIHRARRMLSAAFFVSLAVFAGRLCGHNHALTIALEFICAFIAGLLVALGSPADIGTITLVTLIVFSATPAASFGKALTSGALALAGGILQTLFSLALWPVHRYAPESRALALLYDEMARNAESATPATEAPPATDTILAARSALAALDANRSVEAERYLALFGQAERIRLTLLTLGRLHVRIGREPATGAETDTLARAFHLTARILKSIAGSLAAGAKGNPHADCIAELRNLAEVLREPSASESPAVAAMRGDARWQLDSLTGQLASALELAAHASITGMREFELHEAAQPWGLRLAGVLAVLRANLTPQSAAFRHAVRLAICVAIADTLTRSLGWQRSYWAAMTVVIILKPDFTTTFSRGVLRLAGTFAGLALATALFHALSPLTGVQAVLLTTFMFLMRWVGPANYGVMVTAITALVVLLFALSGVPPNQVIAWRAFNTVAGGMIALIAYRLWPTWERTLVPEALARMFDAYRAYFQSVRDGYVEADPLRSEFLARLDEARQAGRLARTNLEASIARLRSEPGFPAERLTALNTILANAHRLIHAMMALEAGLFNSQPVPARPAFRTFANSVDATIYFLAAYLRGTPVRAGDLPDLREQHRTLRHSGDPRAERYQLVNVETDRVTNSLNTLSLEIIHWVSSNEN
uniref:Integral membrane bound transporter domain-containing protein n=1 Tax=Solibacter usitatus (strain Ellin6076) TaxID=234267 RepID=Q01YB3_SOLUE